MMLLKWQLCTTCAAIAPARAPRLGFTLAPSLCISHGALCLLVITEACSLDEAAGDCLSSAGCELQEEEELMSAPQACAAQAEPLRSSHASCEDASSTHCVKLILVWPSLKAPARWHGLWQERGCLEPPRSTALASAPPPLRPPPAGAGPTLRQWQEHPTCGFAKP